MCGAFIPADAVTFSPYGEEPMRRTYALIALVPLLLAGCMSGASAVEANRAASEAAAAARVSSGRAIATLAAELKTAKTREIELATQLDVAAASSGGQIDVAVAQSIYGKALAKTQAVNANVDSLADRFVADPNWAILMDSLGLSSSWLQAHVRNREMLKGLIMEVRSDGQ